MPAPVLIPTEQYFKPFAGRYVDLNARTGGWLLAFFSLTRFALVLQANVTKSYQVVALIFVAMILLPFLLLTRAGRRQIGLVWPARWGGVLLGGVLGVVSCAVLFYLATLCFGLTGSNPLVYISRTYRVPIVLTEDTRRLFFLIYAGISMLFSPIGEELFYRGLVHECFRASMGNARATLLDSAAFAGVHLAHFGLVYSGSSWHFLPGPSLLWVAALFVSCLLFSLGRAKSGSVLGAIVAHALFNVTMSYFIFYHIL
ncbi:CPBP family intramembrane glutamic endopeptidase [Hymenobacter cellulosilyticus]|uniref:CPBP family intramembrane metalloprotease n=1 Tax=Hymenobacter cellulosilyticus TaxID=2932248 RepID=A0A8T9Q9X4_9BACT|nr:CPBP family intramembrane glutamic endopeptidase [Hymenobacter cellulosilyticus]UOQ71733.1 CPBP family intramembrane metalloprotease [Hymenobacter cellulosilyticus]